MNKYIPNYNELSNDEKQFINKTMNKIRQERFRDRKRMKRLCEILRWDNDIKTISKKDGQFLFDRAVHYESMCNSKEERCKLLERWLKEKK